MRARCGSAGLAILALVVGTAMSASGLDQRQSGSPAITSGPNLSEPEPTARVVEIDAVVIDKRGRPVLNLLPSDFEIVENGVVQKVNAAELHRASAPAASAVVPIMSADDEERAAREPGTRVLALLLDEFHVSAGPNSDRVRESLLHFIDQEVRPTDLLAVLKPLDPVTEIRFTRDRDAARKSIQTFSGRKGNYEARTEFEQKYIGRAPAAVQAARAQIVLSGLRALTSKIGELGAGRAAIVLVTQGFPRPRFADVERRVPDVQGLVRSASRARVAFYTFDPEGSPAPAADSADVGEIARNRGFLQTIAVETGGEAVMNAADLTAGLQRVSRDLDGYYVLTYTSSHTADGRFYDVQVRTTRRDAEVRTRSGYWAPLRMTLMRGTDGRLSAAARVMRRSPLIDTWLGLSVTPDGEQHVTFTWEPAEWKGRAPRPAQQPSAVALKVTTPDGVVLFEGEITAPRAGMAAGREDAAFFEARPGRIQFDLTIFAADGTRIDYAAHDVDVPDANRADPVILPPQIFRSSSAKEFREISRDPAAAPVPAREFRRTERLLLRVPTHSASGAAVAMTARVVNQSGHVLRELAPMAGTATQEANQFDLPLAWLAPGEYALELNAVNGAGAAKEIVRFRVTG